jgi:F-type H+-transporting ATPase subunit epsilon
MDQELPTVLDLQVVTPERPLLSEKTTSVSLPGKDGRLGILPGHAPLVSELATGVLFFEQGAQTRFVAVQGGFVEVLPGRVLVLATRAERGESIDRERAGRARQEAEEGKSSTDDAESRQAQEDLDWSQACLAAADSKRDS